MSEETRTFCSVLSRQADEALFATATPTRVYLLLEYRGNWGEKAVEESVIPESVKARLTGFAKSLPAAKLLLIRGHSGDQPDLHFFIADVPKQVRYEFLLERYEDILSLDLAAILADAPEYRGNRRQETLYLVCTNGRRDACCGKFGVAVYNALYEATRHNPDGQVWQVSHVGGHRFAANVLALPQGLLYGRLRTPDAPALVEAHRQNHVLLEHLRGNTAYSAAAQAAEYHLRLKTGEMELDAYRLLDEQAVSEEKRQVRFTAQNSGAIHSLTIALEKSEAKSLRKLYPGQDHSHQKLPVGFTRGILVKLATLCYVRRAGKTLMIHRIKKANDMHQGKWNGLGGKLDPGETPEECAIREIYEELGLTVRNPLLKGFITFPGFANEEDWYTFLFVCTEFEGTLVDFGRRLPGVDRR